MAVVPIVNINDELIATKDRSDIDYVNDIFRTASVWVRNGNGDVLLAQRKWDKKVDPGKWGEAIGGTVEGDDSYLLTAKREAAEELGLENIELTLGPKQLVRGDATYFVQWYIALLDLPVESITLQEEEVLAVQWFHVDQLKADIIEHPERYIHGMQDMFTLLETA